MDLNTIIWRGPLSLSQSDIYFDQKHYPDRPVYNVGGYISLPEIDVEVLTNAHISLVENNDIFGLRVGSIDESLQQWIVKERSLSLELIDFSSFDNADAQKWLTKLFQQTIEVDDKPLFRAYLLKICQNSYYYVGIAHHIMMDGWGFANWAHDLGMYYNAITNNRSAEVSEISWSSIIERELNYINTDKFDQHKAFWQKQLEGYEGNFLQAKYRQQYDDLSDIQGGRKTVAISRSKHAQLELKANELGVPVSQLYFAIIVHYFARAYDKQTLCFGFPMHNRKGRAEKQALGTFANISPILIGHDECNDLSELCSSLGKKLRQVMKHQKYSVGKIKQDILGLSNDAHLYDVTFNYLDLDAAFSVNEIPAELNYVGHNHEVLPIKFTVWNYGKSQDVELQIDYNKAYFDELDLHYIERRLNYIVNQVCRSGNLALSQLNVLDEQEVAFVTEKSLAKGAFPFEYSSLFELISSRAKKVPDNIALYDGIQALTYAECIEKVERYAAFLHANGVEGRNSFVGICMQRSVELVIAMLAVNRLGAAYVPLDSKYPEQRLQYIISDAALDVVLVDETTSNMDCLEALTCFDIAKMAQEQPKELPSVAEISITDRAYILYTSGSTGKPKGVILNQQNVLSLLLWAERTYTREQLSYVLASTSACFDLSVFEMFAPLVMGGTTRIASNILALPTLQDAAKITLISGVPSAIESLLSTGEIPRTLKVVNSCGEPLIQETVKRLGDQLPDTIIYDLYGPSEDTTYSTFGQRFPEQVGNIGTPLFGTHAYILDSKGKLVPFGIEGELYLGGPGLSEGYLNKPEMTAQRFLSVNVVGSESTQRLYRTGDLVRWMADGNLQYLGRIDNQLKLRGFRIELDEIKNLLNSAEDVVESHLAVVGERGEANLIAFVMTSNAATKSKSEIAGSLSLLAHKHLPDYMVPSTFHLCDSFPQLPNGKVDLTALQNSIAKVEKNVVAPVNATEIAIRNIWAKLLKRRAESISTLDNFFQLGGNSLLCTQMSHELTKQNLAKLNLSEIFSSPTIKSLAAKNSVNAEHSSHSFTRLTKYDYVGLPTPVSFSQYRIWVMHEIKNAGSSQHIPIRLEISQHVEVEALQQVLDRLIAEHDVLRTYFVCNELGEPQQVLFPESNVAVEVIDLSDYAEHDQQRRVDTVCEQHSVKPFVLSELPLFRVLLIKRNDTRYVLQLTFHHIVLDAWSAMQLLGAVCDQLFTRTNDNRKQSKFSYIDYTQSQLNFLASSSADAQRDFWREKLIEFPTPIALPWRGERSALDHVGDEDAKLLLDAELVCQLKDLAQQNKCTLFTVIHTCLAVLLARITGQTELAIGTPTHSRHTESTDTILGVFLNLLPLQSRLLPEAKFTDLLGLHRHELANAMTHQDLPLEELNSLANEGERKTNSALFNVLFNMLNVPNTLENVKQVALVTDVISTIPNKFDFTLYAIEKQEGDTLPTLTLHASYDKRKFSSDKVNYALAQLQCLLKQVVISPQLKWLEYDLSAKETAASSTTLELDVCNASAPSLNDLLADIVAQYPHAPALQYQNNQLTYEELGRQTDLCAARLKALGVNQNQCVAIFAHRHSNFVVSLLSVLKLGAHFVILSPEYEQQISQHQLDTVEPIAWISFSEEDEGLALSLGLAQERGLILTSDKIQENLSDENFVQSKGDCDTLAYVAFTSGTTGKPKAVYGHHGSISAVIPEVATRYSFEPGTKVGMLSSLTHDPILRDVFYTLASGACLFIPDEQVYKSSSIMTWLAQNNIDLVNLTPSFIRQFANYTQSSLPTLKHIFFGGEPLTRKDVEITRSLWHDVRITNLYGTTESGRALSAFDITSASQESLSSHYCENSVYPIGQGLSGVNVLVLNHYNDMCSIGEVGQVGIQSAFLPNSERTRNEKYINSEAGEIYLTGDLGRYLPTGDVEILGRRDQQIKYRGHRVELGEVEAQLCSYDNVQYSYVFCDKPNSDTASLVAAITVNDFQSWRQSDTEELRSVVSSKLPSFKVPTHIVVMKDIPITHNNKIDKNKLARLALDQIEKAAKQGLVKPDNETESALAEIWCQLLGKEEVSVLEEFYSMGGNSILATRLISQVQRKYNIDFSYQDFVTDTSIRAVAKKVSEFLNQQSVIEGSGATKKMTIRI